MQLLEINKVNTNDLQGNEIQYSVRIQDKVVELYERLDTFNIDDAVAGASFLFDFTKTNIIASWYNNTWDNNGYVFPLMWNGTNEYDISEFKPAMFHKTLLTEVIDYAGYRVGGTFYENNTNYEKDIIPYNGDKVIGNSRDEACISADGTGEFTYRFGKIPEGTVPNKVPDNIYLDTYFVPFALTGQVDNQFDQYDYSNLGFNAPTSESCSISPFLTYDAFAGAYIVNEAGFYNLGGLIEADILWDSLGDEVWKYNITQYSFNQRTNYSLKVYMFVNGIYTTTKSQVFTMPMASGGQLGDSTFNAANGYQWLDQASIDLSYNNIKLYKNDRITFKVKLQQVPERNKIANYRNCGSTSYCGSRALLDITTTFKDTCFFRIEPSREGVIEGDEINVTNYIPKNVKATNLINDVIKRYNLIIRTDPNDSKKILLDTRDDYYNNDTTPIIDWTQKKDYSQKDNIKLLSELQNKEMVFTYSKANDEDLLNKEYSNNFREETIYGQKKIVFDNEFVKGTKKIQTPFAPTVMTYNSIDSPNMVVPYIDSVAPNTKPRVLHWGGVVDTQDKFGDPGNKLRIKSFDDNNNPTVSTLDFYPYAGHFDHPFTPTLDINYGVNQEKYLAPISGVTFEPAPFLRYGQYFYNRYDKIPSNNLYNTYWRKTIEQLSKGRLVTSYFHLTANDIAYIKDNLNARIWVKDSYYHINKIIDYNPLGNGLTKVELTKIIEGFEAKPDDFTGENKFKDTEILEQKAFLEDGESKSGKGKTTGTIIEAVEAKAIGEENRIGKGCIYTIVSGLANEVGNKSPYGTILGSEKSKALAEKATILGSKGCVIEKGAKQSVFIACIDKIMESPNTVKMSATDEGEGLEVQPTAIKIDDGVEITKKEIKISEGYLIAAPNVIEGGLEEVRSIFPQNRYNLIEGGLNELRTAFPKNIPHTLDGGEDSL